MKIHQEDHQKMSSRILCLSKLKNTNSVKLTEIVGAEITLGDAIRQQIQYNIIPPYTPSSTQLTCKTCFNAFENFYKFLTNVKSNLSNTKTDKSFEIAPGYQKIMIASNELVFKMEPRVILQRVEMEPEFIMDYLAEHQKVDDENIDEESFQSNQSRSDFTSLSDDESDLASSCEEAHDMKKYKGNHKKAKEEVAAKSSKSSSKKRRISEDSDEDFILSRKYIKVADRKSQRQSDLRSLSDGESDLVSSCDDPIEDDNTSEEQAPQFEVTEEVHDLKKYKRNHKKVKKENVVKSSKSPSKKRNISEDSDEYFIIGSPSQRSSRSKKPAT